MANDATAGRSAAGDAGSSDLSTPGRRPDLLSYMQACAVGQWTNASTRKSLTAWPTPAFWRYDYNNVRPHIHRAATRPASNPRRALELLDSTAPGPLATPEIDDYQTQRLWLPLSDNRGQVTDKNEFGLDHNETRS
jgi:hypothetical protein